MSVLVVAEHVRGRVNRVTFELLAAARKLAEPVGLVVIGRNPADLDLLEADADEILLVEGPEEFDSDVYRAVLGALIDERKPLLVLTAFTANAMAFAPAVASRVGAGFASDVFWVRLAPGGVIARRA